MKLILVNSTGPMGSSVVSAMIEKLGYLNIPMRDQGLHQYLISKKETDLTLFHSRFMDTAKTYSRKKIAVGGVNMLDRDSSGKRQILNQDVLDAEISRFDESQYTEVSKLYEKLRDIFSQSIIYKKNIYKKGKHVELTASFHHYPMETLYAAYQQHFSQVILIHMHRNFVDWMESLASQRFSNPAKRYKFVLRWEYGRYQSYEEATADFHGLHLDFDSLFSQDFDKTIDTICQAISENPEKIDWRNEKYDLYGNVRTYQKAFSKADYPGKYLSKLTRKAISYGVRSAAPTRFNDLLVYVLYLFDLFRFLMKKKYKDIFNNQHQKT